MESSHKRQRLSGAKVQVGNLQQRRARNDNQLKSIFESIFDKYGKDFDGIGDEIDLRTGEIVVDNGHVIGMKSERDPGTAGSSSEEYESEYSSEEEDDRQDVDGRAMEGVCKELGNAALSSEPETGRPAIYDIDFLTQRTETDPLFPTFEKSPPGQMTCYDSGEDELADSAIEWVTPREARAIAHQKWQLPGDGPTFTDESLVEEAWRAPPLPKCTTPCITMQKAVPVTDRRRESIDSEAAVISLWNSSARKRRHSTLAEAPQADQPISVPTFLNRPGGTHGSPSQPKGNRRKLAWTQEEEDTLRHLKQNTTLIYREMESYFPARNWESVASKWTQMVHCGKATRILDKDVRRGRRTTFHSTPDPASPTSKGTWEDSKQFRSQRQRSFKADGVRTPKLRRSCDACFSSKNRCDHDRPICMRCQKIGLECSYSALQKNGEYSTVSEHAEFVHQVSNMCGPEAGRIVQRPVDGCLKSSSQDLEISWLPGNHSTSAQTPSGEIPTTETHSHNALGQMQQGFLTQPSPSDQKDESCQAERNRSPPIIDHRLDSDRRSNDFRTGSYTQEYLHTSLSAESSRNNATLSLPNPSSGVGIDAAVRQKICLDKVITNGQVVVLHGTPQPQAEFEGRFIDSQPFSDNRNGSFLRAAPPKAASKIATSVHGSPAKESLAVPKDPHPEDSPSNSSVGQPQEAKQSPPDPRKLPKPRTPSRVSIGPPARFRHAVQVVIPIAKRNEAYEAVPPTGSNLAEGSPMPSMLESTQSQENVTMPVSGEISIGPDLADEVPLNRKTSLDLEIPDSQPEFSSPIFVKEEDTGAITANNEPSSKGTSSLACEKSEQDDHQAIANIDDPGSEFDDELSMLNFRPKRRVEATANSSIPRTRLPQSVTALNHQAFLTRTDKVTKTEIADSFSSMPSDMLDCGEDELSFM